MALERDFCCEALSVSLVTLHSDRAVPACLTFDTAPSVCLPHLHVSELPPTTQSSDATYYNGDCQQDCIILTKHGRDVTYQM